MALPVEVAVEMMLERAGRIIGNDGCCALVGDRLTQGITVIGGVGYDDPGRQSFDEAGSLWCIAPLPGSQREGNRTTKPADSHVDLGTQAAA